MSFNEARIALQQRIEQGQPAPVPAPSELALDGIELIEDVFQHRRCGIAPSDSHANSLASALKNNPREPLEPIKVFWVSDDTVS